MMVDWEKAIENLFKAQRLDIKASGEEIARRKEAKQQQQQPIQMQIAQLKAKSDMEREQLSSQTRLQEEQIKLQRQQEEQAFNREQDELKRQHEAQLKNIEFQIEMMRLAQDKEISLEQIKRSLTETSAKLQTQERIATNTLEAGQVIEPAVEPPGRAPNGQAFQR